jgi:hypothetical protein
MPTKADAPAEEHSNDCTQAAGSQFRCVHSRSLAVCFQTVALRCVIPITEAREHNPSHDLNAARTGCLRTARARDRPSRRVDRISDRATGNHDRDGLPGRLVSGVPASLLPVSGPTRGRATAMPALPSLRTTELSRRACAAGVGRPGNVLIRCPGSAGTWLVRCAAIRSTYMPSTSSAALRESRGSNRHRYYDRCRNRCSAGDLARSCHSLTVSLYA